MYNADSCMILCVAIDMIECFVNVLCVTESDDENLVSFKVNLKLSSIRRRDVQTWQICS